MTQIVVNQNVACLPNGNSDCIPVQLYGINGRERGDVATIGSPIISPIRRLGIKISPLAFDFMTLALAVTAADTFVKRSSSPDGWARDISLKVSLFEPDPWQSQKELLEKTLHFLSGDIWHLELAEGGHAPPEPYRRRQYHVTRLTGLDSVSLFSGGIDSTIGVLDLLKNGKKPLLVSHAYRGDQSHQDSVAFRFPHILPRFSVNAHPISIAGKTEITMRTRSFNFLAFGVVGACAVSMINRRDQVSLFIPENGFISLNVPLTPRRTGSLSTRTTHPYFLSSMQSIFDAVGISVQITNPYQFMTKGEMIRECLDQKTLRTVLSDTVSCSNWKRKNRQCGRCVPCLIRRAAIAMAGYTEPSHYLYQDLNALFQDGEDRDDLSAIMIAIRRLNPTLLGSLIMSSGPLSADPNIRESYKGVFIRGIREVEHYLKCEGVLND